MLTRPDSLLKKFDFTIILSVLFGAVLIGRFAFPLFHNPIDSLYIDMLRHLFNGHTMFDPNYINGMDPKGFQVWMNLIERFPEHEQRTFFGVANALLCASMPWFWYKALREMTSRGHALIISILIGIHLSFLVIYQFFLIETLLLTMVALSMWLTLRSARKGTLASFGVAMAAWVFTIFTKPTAIPMMLLAGGFAIGKQEKKVCALTIGAVLFLAALIPAAMQSFKALHYVAPFGITEMQTISRKSKSTSFGLQVTDRFGMNNYLWSPEAFYFNPLTPFGNYVSTRSGPPYVVQVDVQNGRADIDKAMIDLRAHNSWSDVAHQYMENFIFLFCTYSYPDSVLKNDSFWLRWNYHWRWTWPPCLLLVMLCAPFLRMTPLKTLLVFLGFSTAWAFLLQDVGIVEGRYRKIIEPFLIAGSYFVLQAVYFPDKKEGTVSLWKFLMTTYIYPSTRLVLDPIFADDAKKAAAQAVSSDTHGGKHV